VEKRLSLGLEETSACLLTTFSAAAAEGKTQEEPMGTLLPGERLAAVALRVSILAPRMASLCASDPAWQASRPRSLAWHGLLQNVITT
jgi:hypothetical protein